MLFGFGGFNRSAHDFSIWSAPTCRRFLQNQSGDKSPHSITKNRSIEKDGTVAITVSPFDGVNRIRFKGSPTHCGFAIVDCRLNSSFQIGNRKLAISNDPGLSASILVDVGSPETYLVFKLRNLRTL